MEAARVNRMLPLLESVIDDVVYETAISVVMAGEKIKMLTPEFKTNEGEGHRSGHTEGDKIAHQMIFDRLGVRYPDAKFLSEEGKGEDPRLLAKENPIGISREPLVIIYDPLDGTAPYGSQTGYWCVAAGIMRYGNLVGSAIYAPAINGGMLVVSELGNNVWISEWDFTTKICLGIPPAEKALKKCFVMMGVDSTLYPNFATILPEIGRNIRALGLANSGILGLALLACGRIQAVIQTPQKVWDWAPAWRAVITSGNIFRFFRFAPESDQIHNSIMAVDSYDYESFCLFPKENRLGFVAGQPDIVDWIFNLLPKTGWQRMNPDTVEKK